jgi:LuxR family transcriptional regulator, maltose regulon positive regulatory protein
MKAGRFSAGGRGQTVPGKLTRPRPVGVLGRGRLFRALDRACRCPAVWVVGPPGAGKTTLVSAYVERRRLRTIWYRMDGDDADAATFFHYFGLAVEAAAPGRGREALPRFTADYLQDLPVFSRRYFEQVYQRLRAPCVLVLDNYQQVPPDARLHEVIRDAAESLPAGVNLVILSRDDVPPPLAALRAREKLALVGAENLNLTAAECAAIARLRKVDIGEAALRELHQRTQGWTAGVVLALEQRRLPLSAWKPAPDATPEVIFDYFAGEIFGRMDKETQALLLQAAFLPTMQAQRIADLTGEPGAARVLGRLARRNYFTIKLARPQAAGAMYQFHPLFREFLLRRAEQALAPAALQGLRLKAAELLWADGECAGAVELLIAARAWDGAMRVMLDRAPDMQRQGRGRILEGWLDALPASLRERRPWVLYWRGMCRLAFDPPEARRHLERAFELFDADQDDAGAFSAWAAVVETYMYEWGEFAPLDRWIALLDELVARFPAFPSPSIEERVCAAMLMALMYRQPQRDDLPRWAERVRSIVLGTSDTRTQMILGNQLVHYYVAWRGDGASARLVTDAIRPATEEEVGPLAHIAWCSMRAGHYWHAGAAEDCMRMVESGLETMRRCGARFMNSMLQAHAVMGALVAKDFAQAERLLDSTGNESGRLLYWAHHRYLSLLTAFCKGDMRHAVASGREAVAFADEAGVPFSQAQSRLALARALFEAGRRGEALRYLAEARRLARRGRIFTTESSCLGATAYFLLRRGKRRQALPFLRGILGIVKPRGRVHRPLWTTEFMTCLYAAALEHGIETDFVRASIRERRLAPPDGVDLERWPLPVKVYTLGRLTVLLDDEVLRFKGKPQRKPLDLLMALIALGGRDVSERDLTEALWPSAEGDAAHRACAAALHRLRKLLRCEEAVQVHGNRYALDARHVWVDAWAFERGLAPDGKESPERSDKAIALYQGPFLAGFGEFPWATALREKLRMKFVRHVAERGRALLAAGDHAQAAAVFEKGLMADALAEELYHGLMRSYEALERRADAVAVFERCRSVLQARLGVSPGSRTVALYRSLHQ